MPQKNYLEAIVTISNSAIPNIERWRILISEKIKAKGITCQQLRDFAGISNKLYYQLRDGTYFGTTKVTHELFQSTYLAVYLADSWDEAIEMLRLSGHVLNPAISFDDAAVTLILNYAFKPSYYSLNIEETILDILIAANKKNKAPNFKFA